MARSVTKTPLCTVSYCPQPRNPDWHVCLHCESPVIEHHHAQPRSRGGGKESVVPVCHWVHQGVHDRTLINFIEDGMYVLTTKDGELLGQWDIETGSGMSFGGAQVAPEPVVLPTAPDEPGVTVQVTTIDGNSLALQIAEWADMDDARLATEWANAQQIAESVYLRQCAIAHLFHALWGHYGDRWAERAAEVIRNTTGIPCSPSMVRDRKSAAIALMTQPDPETFLANCGITITVAVGNAEDVLGAAEYAQEQRDAGRPMVEVADEIDARPETLLECPFCVGQAPRREFRRVK